MPTAMPAWPNKQTRDQFFAEFKELLEKYPHLKSTEDAPERFGEDMEDGYPEFDPASPLILQGIVVILSYSNLEHFEDIQILDPFEQSFYMSYGLLARAGAIFGLDED